MPNGVQIARLFATIGADISGLQKGAAQVKPILENIEKSTQSIGTKLTSNFNQAGAAATKTAQNMRGLSDVSLAAANAQHRLSQAIVSAQSKVAEASKIGTNATVESMKATKVATQEAIAAGKLQVSEAVKSGNLMVTEAKRTANLQTAEMQKSARTISAEFATAGRTGMAEFAKSGREAMRTVNDGLNQVNTSTSAVTKSTGFLHQSWQMLRMTPTFFVAAEAGLMLNSVLRGLGDATIGFNARLEQARIAFTTLTGSASAANKHIQELMQFAQKTPFDVEGLIQSSQLLQGVGFAARDVIPLLTNVGNVMSALGRGTETFNKVILAITQIQQKGRLMGQEAIQLAEAGISAYEVVAEYTGKTVAEVRKMGEEGQITSDIFMKAFAQWSQANFGGMMEAQAKTAIGAWQNMSDAFKKLASTASQPIFDKLSSSLQGMANALQSGQATAAAEALAKAFEHLDTVVLALSVGGMIKLYTSMAGVTGALVLMSEAVDKLKLAFAALIANPIIAALMAIIVLGYEGKKAIDAEAKAWRDGTAAMTNYAEAGGAVGASAQAQQRALNKARMTHNAYVQSVNDARKATDAIRDSTANLNTGLALMEQNLASLTPAWADFVKQLRDADTAQKQWVEDLNLVLTKLGTQVSIILLSVGNVMPQMGRAFGSLLQFLNDISGKSKEAADNALKLAENLAKTKVDSLQALIKNLDPFYRAIEQQRKGYEDQQKALRNQEKAITDQQSAIRSQLDAISNKEQEIRDHADEVAKAYDAQTQALQDQIAALTAADPAQKMKDLSLNLRKTRLEEQLARVDADSATGKSIQKQIDTIDKQVSMNSLKMEEKRIQGEILAMPLEKQVEDLKAAREKDLATINAELDPLEQQRKKLEGQNTDLQTQKDLIDKQIEAYDPLLAQLDAEKERLDEIKEKYQANIDKINEETEAKKRQNNLPLPDITVPPGTSPEFPDPAVAHRMSQIVAGGLRASDMTTEMGVGYRLPNGKWEPHNWGEDFAMPVGTALMAPMDAIIEKFGPNGDWGNQITMKLANGAKVIVSHLSGFAQTIRDGIVSAGETIGWSGNTGFSSGPHLDIQTILAGGKVVRPLDFFKNLLGGQGGGGTAGAADAFGIVDQVAWAIEQLKTLKTFSPPDPNLITAFGYTMHVLVSTVKDVQASVGTTEGLDTFAERTTTIVSSIQTISDGLAALKTIDMGGMSNLSGLEWFMKTFLTDLRDMSAGFQGDLSLEKAVQFVMDATSVLMVIQPFADAVKVLKDFEMPTGDNIVALRDSMWAVLTMFRDMAPGLVGGDIGLDNAIKLAENATSIVAVIAPAIDAFDKLAKFKIPKKGIPIKAFEDVFWTIVRGIQGLAESPELKGDLAAAGAQLSENAKKIFDMVDSAIGSMLKLADKDFKVPKGASIKGLEDFLWTVVRGIQGLAKAPEFVNGQLDEVVVFANQVSTIFDTLKSGVEAMNAVAGAKDAPGKALNAIIDGMKTALSKMDALVSQSAEFLAKAITFRDNMLAAAQAIAEGLAAIGGAPAGGAPAPLMGNGRSVPDSEANPLRGTSAAGHTFNIHINGYNQDPRVLANEIGRRARLAIRTAQ